MNINIGGVQHSCSDSRNSSIIIFLGGCPYRCNYCHNTKILYNYDTIDTAEIKEYISEISNLVSEIIFSGGEPTMQTTQISDISVFAKRKNLKIGIETSGAFPENMKILLDENIIDNVYIDMKTYGTEEYEKLTGSKNAWDNLIKCIDICKKHNVYLEIRTTIFDKYPSNEIVKKISEYINDNNLNWKKQNGIANMNSQEEFSLKFLGD